MTEISYSVRSLNGAECFQRGSLTLARYYLSEARDRGDETARIVRDDTGEIVLAPFGVDAITGLVLPDAKGRYYLGDGGPDDARRLGAHPTTT